MSISISELTTDSDIDELIHISAVVKQLLQSSLRTSWNPNFHAAFYPLPHTRRIL